MIPFQIGFSADQSPQKGVHNFLHIDRQAGLPAQADGFACMLVCTTVVLDALEYRQRSQHVPAILVLLVQCRMKHSWRRPHEDTVESGAVSLSQALVQSRSTAGRDQCHQAGLDWL